MTRVLAELLGAVQPAFQAGLRKLEQASGHESTDVRLTADITQAGKRKLRELGLDPSDTTGRELYQALAERFAQDEKRLFSRLREEYGDADDLECVVREIERVPIPKSSFALKATVAKRLLKKSAPKKAMKALGYRSFESMLKHEHISDIYAAAWLTESATWRKQLIDSYKKLKVNDFEIRPMQISYPKTEKWQNFANVMVADTRHNVVSFKELGAVVLLPLPDEKPPAAAMTSLLLALHAMNEIRAASTFLKLAQMQPGFGTSVYQTVLEDSHFSTSLFADSVPWQIIQRYYGRFADKFRAEIFEPHVQVDDLTWHSIEKILSFMDPTLDFWRHTTHLSLLHDHQPVSFNIVDVAINYANALPYEQRVLTYSRQSLWHELIIRYLKHEKVEETVVSGLRSDLVPQAELAA
ncbi:hypothetical protein KDA23_03100 [Candidatus Saccharibacteria bacterium]|nr:hypothetical protein [Candidatus Saccharibacteria bacterium]